MPASTAMSHKRMVITDRGISISNTIHSAAFKEREALREAERASHGDARDLSAFLKAANVQHIEERIKEIGVRSIDEALSVVTDKVAEELTSTAREKAQLNAALERARREFGLNATGGAPEFIRWYASTRVKPGKDESLAVPNEEQHHGSRGAGRVHSHHSHQRHHARKQEAGKLAGLTLLRASIKGMAPGTPAGATMVRQFLEKESGCQVADLWMEYGAAAARGKGIAEKKSGEGQDDVDDNDGNEEQGEEENQGQGSRLATSAKRSGGSKATRAVFECRSQDAAQILKVCGSMGGGMEINVELPRFPTFTHEERGGGHEEHSGVFRDTEKIRELRDALRSAQSDMAHSAVDKNVFGRFLWTRAAYRAAMAGKPLKSQQRFHPEESSEDEGEDGGGTGFKKAGKSKRNPESGQEGRGRSREGGGRTGGNVTVRFDEGKRASKRGKQGSMRRKRRARSQDGGRGSVGSWGSPGREHDSEDCDIVDDGIGERGRARRRGKKGSSLAEKAGRLAQILGETSEAQLQLLGAGDGLDLAGVSVSDGTLQHLQQVLFGRVGGPGWAKER